MTASSAATASPWRRPYAQPGQLSPRIVHVLVNHRPAHDASHSPARFRRGRGDPRGSRPRPYEGRLPNLWRSHVQDIAASSSISRYSTASRRSPRPGRSRASRLQSQQTTNQSSPFIRPWKQASSGSAERGAGGLAALEAERTATTNRSVSPQARLRTESPIPGPPEGTSSRFNRTPERFLFVRGVKSFGKVAASPLLLSGMPRRLRGRPSGVKGAAHRACARRPAAAH